MKQFPELVTESTFLEGLFDFLADHSLDANRPKAAEGNSASSSPPVASPSSHEQEELRRAIAASLANEDVVVVEDGENQSAEALPDSTSKVTSSASLLFPGRNLANHSIGSQVMQAVLKSEPPKDSTQPLATLRFIFPDSSRLQRRFFADETLQVRGPRSFPTSCGLFFRSGPSLGAGLSHHTFHHAPPRVSVSTDDPFTFWSTSCRPVLHRPCLSL